MCSAVIGKIAAHIRSECRCLGVLKRSNGTWQYFVAVRVFKSLGSQRSQFIEPQVRVAIVGIT